jgi:uridine monophosphate synthetase
MTDPLTTDRPRIGPSAPAVEDLAARLHDIGAVKFGTFTLKSGLTSPVYIDLRLLMSDAELLRVAARAYASVMQGLAYDRIAAIPYGGVPIGAAVALETGRPMIYPRKEVKGHGTGQPIEGVFEAGETALVLDDLISSGGSKLEAIAPLEAAGLIVRDVVVLVDREGGGAEELAAEGYRLHRFTTLAAIARALAALRRIDDAQLDVVERYLEGE